MDTHQILFSWTENPTVKGKIKIVKEFKDLGSDNNKLNFGELLRQVDQLDNKETIKPYDDLDWVKEEFDYLTDEKNEVVYCYFVDNVLVGLTCIKIIERRNTKSIDFYYISVLPSNKGSGIATLLINKVFKDYPKHTYYLSVHADNPKAKEVYERMGFRPRLISMVLDNNK